MRSSRTRLAPAVAVPRSQVWFPVALAVVTQVDVWLPRPVNLGHLVGPPVVVSLLYAVTSLLLFWRRRSPVAVLATIVALDAVVYLAFGAPEGLGSFLPTLCAFYAVGRYARGGALAVAGPLVLLGTAMHELKDPVFAFGGSEAFLYLILAAAWPLGRVFHTQAAQRQAMVDRSEALEHQRDTRAREAVAEERAALSRELHDVVGHGLSVVVLQLVGADALLQRGRVDLGRAKVAGAESSARSALDEMRRLLLLLGEDRGPSAPDPPAPAPGLRDLDGLLDQARAAGAQISLKVEGQSRPMPAGVDLTAYRIVQESLTNVLKHAHPPRATVLIDYRADEVLVEVLDEGHQIPAAEEPRGRGLAGLRERVVLNHGTLRAGPRPGTGFAVSARLPIP